MSSPDGGTDLDTRERILRQTWRLMEEQRGHGVRLEDIARAAGTSRQAIYLHFGSRAGLLIATARYLDDSASHGERTRHIRETRNGEEALRELIRFWAGYIPDIYGLAKALMSVRATDAAAASAWNDRMAAFIEKCALVVRLLDENERLAPEWSVETATDFLWSLLSIATWEHLTIDRGWTQEQYVAHIQYAAGRALIAVS